MSADARDGGSRVGEWLTVLVLLAMAGVLLWIYVSLKERKGPRAYPAFALKNPMLDARPNECVEVSGTDRPNAALCVSVLEAGLVLRPTTGPQELGPQTGLRLAPPYLACRERSLPRGVAGCGALPAQPADGTRRDDFLLYPLDDFGVPAGGHRLRPDSIEPVWAESGGSERLLYLVVLEDYAGGTFKCYVSPDPDRGLVTGLVRVELLSEKAGRPPQVFFYTDIGECP